MTGRVTSPQPEHIDALIVGTGFSGLAAAIKLQERGTRYAILERGDDIGGTWRDNTYPGCRCDVPSPLYSFSFAPNPEWTELYSPQPEIKDYLRKVAVDHDVVRHVRFGTMLPGPSGTTPPSAGRSPRAPGPCPLACSSSATARSASRRSPTSRASTPSPVRSSTRPSGTTRSS